MTARSGGGQTAVTMVRQVVPGCLALALLFGCASAEPLQVGSSVREISVTALSDVNETSATHGQSVHPDDYAGVVSGWYFGHAT